MPSSYWNFRSGAYRRPRRCVSSRRSIPAARPSAATTSRRRAGSSPPWRSRTCTRAPRRSGVISTRVTIAPAARGSLRSLGRSEAISSRTPPSTRRTRMPLSTLSAATIAVLVEVLPDGHELRRSVGEHRVFGGVRRARHLLEHRVAHGRVARDHRHAEHGPLVQVLRPDLRDRHVEARPDPIAELLHDAPLVLERARVRNVKGETQDADEHAPLELLFDLLDVVRLENVLFLEVVESLEADAALEAFGHLARVVLEALEALDLAFPDDGAVADQPDLAGSDDLALGDVAAGDGHVLDLEDLTNLGLAVALLDERRRKQAFHRAAHVFERGVDDRVEAYLDLVLFGERARLAGWPNVESDDDRPRGDGEVHVTLGDGADGRVDDREPGLLGRELDHRLGERFDRALHVALDDDAQLLLAALGVPLREFFERHLGCGRDKALRHLALAALRDLLGLLRVLDCVHAVARVGHLVEAEDLDRRRGPSLLKLLAVLVRHRTDLAETGPR